MTELEPHRQEEMEKAQRLAQAIDDLLKGNDPALDDAELAELLEVARLRHRLSLNWMRLAKRWEGDVWRRVLERIDHHQETRDEEPGS